VPLAARWDKGGTLANEINALVKTLAKTLLDEGHRTNVARGWRRVCWRCGA